MAGMPNTSVNCAVAFQKAVAGYYNATRAPNVLLVAATLIDRYIEKHNKAWGGWSPDDSISLIKVLKTYDEKRFESPDTDKTPQLVCYFVDN